MIGLFLAAAISAGAPAATPTPAADCGSPAICRPAGPVSVMGRDGKPLTVRVTEPIPYLDGDVLSLMPGDVVILRLEPNAEGIVKPVIVSAGSARLADTDANVANLLRAVEGGQVPTGNNIYVTQANTDLHTPPNEIRITFRQAPGRPDSVLIVEDGYGDWLRYHASMVTTDGARPTDVCDVQSPTPGLEHWPHPILVIRLSELSLIPPQLDANGQPIAHCE